MKIIAGQCRIKLSGQNEWNSLGTGEFFKVPGKSSFDITVDSGIVEYLCSMKKLKG